MQSSSTQEPEWHTELAAASKAIPVQSFTASTLLKRSRLMQGVKADGVSPEKWLAILRCLNDERKQMARSLPAGSQKHAEMHRALFSLYHRAVNMIPVTHENRRARTYLDLWLQFVQMQAEDSDAYEDVRALFKFIKMQRIGREEPIFYKTWVKFEESHGETAKAKKVLDEAAKCIPGFTMSSPSAATAPSATPSSRTTPKPSAIASSAATPTPASVTAPKATPVPARGAASFNFRVTPLPASTRPPAFRSDRKVVSSPASRQAETPVTTQASRRYAHITNPQNSKPGNLPKPSPSARPHTSNLPAYLSRSKTSQPSSTPNSVLQDVPQPQTLSRAKTSPAHSGKPDSLLERHASRVEKENVMPSRSEAPRCAPVQETRPRQGYRSSKENKAPDRLGSPELIRSATRPADVQREPYEAARNEERYNHAASRRADADYRDYRAKYVPVERQGYASKSPPLNDPIFARREGERNSDRSRAHARDRDRDEEAEYARDVRGYDRPYSSQRRSHGYSPVLDTMRMNENVTIKGRNYLVLGQVGKGGSSQVFKVLDENLEMFALKRVRARGESLQNFSNEIDLLRRLRGHPSIVELHDWELQTGKGLLHVVMEYGEIDLSKLLQRMRGKSIPEAQRMTYWENMLHAVQVIHEEKIVHSDLKPANFLQVSGSLKLIDFGIAKAIVSEDTTKIIRDAQVGTPNYMSPEALIAIGQDESEDTYDEYRPPSKGKFRISRASDIWSLGCILYQMTFKRPPFAHIRDQNMKLLKIQDPNHEINFPKHGNPHLISVLRGCLQRDPSKRLTIPQLLDHVYLRPADAFAPAYLVAGTGQMIVEGLRRRGISIVGKGAHAEEIDALLAQKQPLEDVTATHSLVAERLPLVTPSSSRITATAPSNA